jgi:hypothetical protein
MLRPERRLQMREGLVQRCVSGLGLAAGELNLAERRLRASHEIRRRALLDHGLRELALPDGANLAQLQFWAYDDDPSYGLTFEVYESCQSGNAPPTSTVIASADTFGAIGYYFGSRRSTTTK